MPDNFINITALNDFLFCPYSIYLHNAFMDMDEDIFVAKPQVKGKAAHKAIDSRAFSENENDVQSLKVFSNELGLVGVIDLLKKDEKHLIEYKYKVGDSLFLGQKMQLWAQYFCLIEMGYMVQKISIYEKSTGIFHDLKIPDNADKLLLTELIKKFQKFDFRSRLRSTPKNAHIVSTAIYAILPITIMFITTEYVYTQGHRKPNYFCYPLLAQQEFEGKQRRIAFGRYRRKR